MALTNALVTPKTNEKSEAMDFDGPSNILLGSVGRPPFIYGTAWKGVTTQVRVMEALAAGFTAIDTAAFPQYYREDLVGDAVRQMIEDGRIRREDIFLQTKWTPTALQAPETAPFDPTAPVEHQIKQSLLNSLWNLRPEADVESSRTAYIDCYIMHTPLLQLDDTLRAWREMERHVPARVRYLGISNVSLSMLRELCRCAIIRPSVVQNCFCAADGYDADIREFCRAEGIVYQGYQTLRLNNRNILASDAVVSCANEADVSAEVVLYAVLIAGGIVPLNGTTNAIHMMHDINGMARLRDWSYLCSLKWNETVTNVWLLLHYERRREAAQQFQNMARRASIQ